MSAIEATAEVFVIAFKTLKPRQREAVLERILQDKVIAADSADAGKRATQRTAPRQTARWHKSFRQSRPKADELAALRVLHNDFDSKEWQW